MKQSKIQLTLLFVLLLNTKMSLSESNSIFSDVKIQENIVEESPFDENFQQDFGYETYGDSNNPVTTSNLNNKNNASTNTQQEKKQNDSNQVNTSLPIDNEGEYVDDKNSVDYELLNQLSDLTTDTLYKRVYNDENYAWKDLYMKGLEQTFELRYGSNSVEDPEYYKQLLSKERTGEEEGYGYFNRLLSDEGNGHSSGAECLSNMGDQKEKLTKEYISEADPGKALAMCFFQIPISGLSGSFSMCGCETAVTESCDFDIDRGVLEGITVKMSSASEAWCLPFWVFFK